MLKLLCLFFLLTVQSAFSTIVPIATLVKFNGVILMNNNPAQVGDEFDNGTMVKISGKDAYVDFKYQNGHVIRAYEGEFKIREITPKKSVIQLLRGKIISIVSKLTPNETFRIKTRHASIGVRGTKFVVQDKGDETYLCVCEGVVEVVRGKNKVKVKKDEDLHISLKGRLTPVVNLNMSKMLDDTIKNF